ncbi:hypothetical protein [Zophobihabitans entericus]|uniref:Uncharacterized protein n=1 Tax=Zophobihabitans entericus TaxID=1635327 RepID=A0A6G9IBC9_9GAMM|nr:hypothetical protein [Zophobihabitans entericus]QIQ21132.1 hypothetical protein IPMB12_05240 [Zophobihabitans entericus]
MLRRNVKLSLLLTTLVSGSAIALLSASTVQTIKGEAPVISLDSGASKIATLNEVITVKLPNGTIVTPAESATTIFTSIAPFNQFITAVEANNTYQYLPESYFYDINGDTPKASLPVNGRVRATWTNVTGAVVTNLAANLDPCDAPYKLTLNATATTVSSQYGDPLSTLYPGVSTVYTIDTDPSLARVCYLRPGSMGKNQDWVGFVNDTTNGPWNSTAYTAIDPNGGGGYSSDFVPGKGFIPTPTASSPAGAKFPTTGFSKATFQLIMSGGQAKYTYSVSASPAGSVTIDATGLVTLVSKPSGTVTLSATPIAGGPTINYPFNIGLWATVQPAFGLYAVTAAQCTTRPLTRAEYTNSPRKNVVQPPNWYPTNNYFSRVIDGSLGGEWGSLPLYTDSGWVGGAMYYWTSDSADGSTANYILNVVKGQIGKGQTGSLSAYVACLG